MENVGCQTPAKPAKKAEAPLAPPEVRFAGAAPRKDGFVAHFILPRPMIHERIVKHEFFPPRHHVNHVRPFALVSAPLRTPYGFNGAFYHGKVSWKF